MLFLKQSTGVTVIIGPYIKRHTGGSEPATSFAFVSGVSLVKAAVAPAFAARNCSQGIKHVGRGFYTCQLTGTDTDTLGMLSVASSVSTCLPVWHDYMVQPANSWDTLFGADKWNVEVDRLTNSGTSVDRILKGGVATGTTIRAIKSGQVATGASTISLLASADRTGTSIQVIKDDVDNLQIRHTASGASVISLLASADRTGTSITSILVDTSTTLQGELDGIEVTVERSGTSVADLVARATRTGASVQTIKDDCDNLQIRHTASGATLISILADTEDLQARHSRTGTSLITTGISLNSAMYTRVQSATSTQLVISRGEKGVGAPAVSVNPLVKIDYIYQWMRNKSETGATSIIFYADDGSTPVQKITHSDSGTTYTKGEIGAV